MSTQILNEAYFLEFIIVMMLVSTAKRLKQSLLLQDINHPAYKQIKDGLVELMSTADATVDKFTEYLNDIHAYCLSKGCYLNTPDDLMYAWEMKQ